MTTDMDTKQPSAEMLEDIEKPSAQQDGYVEGNALLVDKQGNVRRVPVPSSNPNDPLNFKTWEKWGVIITCCWFSVMSLALAGGLGAILNVFFALYSPQGYKPGDIVFLLTLPSLCIGLGNFIILPVSLAYGRRPVFLISTVILLAATIGAACQNSYEGHLASRIIQGLATGASESLLPLMLTEVTFLHERGRVFGLYWTIQNILSSSLNLASSYEAAALGWRWYYWVFVIAIAVGLLFAILFGFETRFARPAVNLDGRVIMTDDFGVTHIIPDDEAQEYLEQHGLERQTDEDDVPKKSYAQMLKPWSEPHPTPGKMIVLSWLRMAQSMTSPAILYVVLASSITLGCVVGASLTYDTVLQQYGWQAQDIGLINMGGVVGGLLGAAYCTLLGEPFVLWMAKRNHGIHKPEHRLVVLVFPAILGFAMLILYGFMATAAFEGGGSSWGIVVSWTLFQMTFTSVLIVTTTFASEASPKHPGPALVMVVGTKNIVSFGVAFGMTPMVAQGGYTWTFGVLAGIFGAIFVLGVPVYILNPIWRRYVTRREEKRGITTTD
ncbi:major facilitator superfamily domain-containing protein [Dactylonectria estremocensis]|uniref:Major facilitator superfamily domain-containing protein n=1 Tax=Dactylonectria estremocensis TaxID=1079267 RepID=A0A9P9JBS6_9HYPO|nr:major facilitator superfamily domain-containing protein [Dactylonectria estremocensis]